jgi:hypothetical protein
MTTLTEKIGQDSELPDYWSSLHGTDLIVHHSSQILKYLVHVTNISLDCKKIAITARQYKSDDSIDISIKVPHFLDTNISKVFIIIPILFPINLQ